MSRLFHAAALLTLVICATPASAVVVFDLTPSQGAALRDICTDARGTPRAGIDTSAVVNCCIPGNAWCVICHAGTPQAPTGCLSLGVPPRRNASPAQTPPDQ